MNNKEIEIGLALYIYDETHVEIAKLLQPWIQSHEIKKLHIVFFASHTRVSAFCEWFISQYNRDKIRTRFIPEYSIQKAIEWIESAQWFPPHIPVLFLEAYGIIKTTNTLQIETLIKPHYCKNFGNVKVIAPHDFCVRIAQLMHTDVKTCVEVLETTLFTRKDKLFSCKDLHDLIFICSVHAYYVKKIELGKKCCQWILENMKGAENYYRFSTDNQQHYNN